MKKKKILSSVLATSMVLSMVPATALAAEGTQKTWYVSTTGSDAGEGTSEAPYATIQKAVNEAQEGDIIKVASGEYNVFVPNTNADLNAVVEAGLYGYDVEHNLLVWKGVTIEAQDPQNMPVLYTEHPGNGNGSSQQTVLITASNVTLKNLDVKITTTAPNKTVEVQDWVANDDKVVTNTAIEGCTINGPVYIGSKGVGAYSITDNNITGSLSIANGAGNAMVDGEEAVISGNDITGYVMVTGTRETGWDLESIKNLPAMTDNRISGAEYKADGVVHNMIVLYSDNDEANLPNADDIQAFIDGNDPDSGWSMISFQNGDGDDTSSYKTNCVGVVCDPVTVTDAEGNVVTYAHLEDAIADAADGDTIALAAGEYDGGFTINKSITLKGANAGVSGTSEDRGEESTITGKITVTGENMDVVIDGLNFTDAGCIESTYNQSTNTDLTVQNCVADSVSATFVSTNAHDDEHRLGTITVKNNKVTNIAGVNLSAFNLWKASEHVITGNYVENINYHAFNLDSTVGNVLFENNTVKNTGKGGFQIANTATGGTVTISNNTFDGAASDPYWTNTDGSKSLNYAAIRIYGGGENAITSTFVIEKNTITNSAVGIWLSNRSNGVTYPFGENVTMNGNDITIKKTENGDGYDVYTASGSFCAIVKDGDAVVAQLMDKDNVITLPAALEKDGYVFLGWSDGTNTYNAGEEVKVSAETTFTAVWSVPSSGSSSSYAITVEKADNGTVTPSRTSANKGLTITLTVKADEGYKLDTITVTDKDGSEVTLTDKGDGKYTFAMPASAVTVKASFVEDDGSVETGLPFTDVKADDWFFDAVKYVYDNELMNGTSTTAFSPYVTTSRAMILTILARYDGVDTTTGSTWYEAGAAWAVEKGVSDGTNLESDVSREQLVTMLWRYLGSPAAEADLTAYPDSASVSDWAVEAMAWAVDTGIITGTDAGELNPQGTATRVEVATMLARFVEAAN